MTKLAQMEDYKKLLDGIDEVIADNKRQQEEIESLQQHGTGDWHLSSQTLIVAPAHKLPIDTKGDCSFSDCSTVAL